MIYQDTSAIAAVNEGRDTPDGFYDPKHPTRLMARSRWHNSGGWRGYYELEAEPGYKILDEGCNTGAYSDAPAGTSNDEVEAQLNALEREHGTIYVVWTPTSNVFSTAFDVLARDPATEPSRDQRGKLIAHKTRLFTDPDGSWRVRYHATDVVAYNAATGKYTLNTGGWATMTTAKRMSAALPGGYHVYRHKWEMYLRTPGSTAKWGQDIKITDGMEV